MPPSWDGLWFILNHISEIFSEKLFKLSLEIFILDQLAKTTEALLPIYDTVNVQYIKFANKLKWTYHKDKRMGLCVDTA